VAQKKAYEVDNFLSHPPKKYPVILIYGTDKGLISERASLFAKKTGVRINDPFSTVYLDAIDIDHDPARLMDEVSTISLFDSNRLIWIRNAGSQKRLADAVRWSLQSSLKQTFILIEAGNLKKGMALRNAIEQSTNAMALPCYNDDAQSIDYLIDDVLSKFNLCISLEARNMLRENLGADRLASRGELEKLCFYAKGKKIIKIEDISQIVSDLSIISQDEIFDAIISGNLSALNDNFDRQKDKGISLFIILYEVQHQFHQMQELRFIMDAKNKNALSVIIDARPQIFFRRHKLIEGALACWNAKRISRAIEQLHKVTIESRKNAEFAYAIVRQNFIALAVEKSVIDSG